MSLRTQIEAILPEVVAIRHDLHRNPELGYKEKRTSQVVKDHLTKWGIEHKGDLARGTGVLAYLPAHDPENSPTIALRADMDALPITEATGVTYTSENKGVMHACGHDGHTSILLGAAKILSENPRKNNVLLVFQPAEEGGAGGKAMCDDGVLDGRILGKRVDRMYGLHGFPMGDLGQVFTRNGPIMAAASQFEIVVHGKGAHAAYPHMGIDPIVIGAHMITALQTIASRSVDPLDSIVVTIGKLTAGVAHNVIPETARLLGTLRALNDETNRFGIQKIEQIAKGIAESLGGTATVEWIGAYPVVVNDPAATETVRTAVATVLGAPAINEMPPTMGGEDFAFYGQRVPAAFFFLGIRPPTQTDYPSLHSPYFDFNDEALPIGIELMCSLAAS